MKQIFFNILDSIKSRFYNQELPAPSRLDLAVDTHFWICGIHSDTGTFCTGQSCTIILSAAKSLHSWARERGRQQLHAIPYALDGQYSTMLHLGPKQEP